MLLIEFFFYILLVFVVVLQQLGGFYITFRNTRHFLQKHRPRKCNPQKSPKAAIIAPYKGIDTAFEKNFDSLFQLDYPDYEIHFVVESQDDPAYLQIQQQLTKQDLSKVPARLVVAELTQSRSQKVHNLLAVIDQFADDIEVFAFVDSDVCVKSHWLSSLVRPLSRPAVGASTGYRIYIPTDNRLSTYALSAINSSLAFFMGKHRFNATWGGTTAITRAIFEKADIAQIWANACTDDYSLTNAIRKQNLEVYFAPACLVPSYDEMSWSQFFSFARRQFIITKVYTKGLWNFALLNLTLYVLTFWGSIFGAAYLMTVGSKMALAVALIPASIYINSIIKGFVRQIALGRIMTQDRRKLLCPAILDIFFQPLHCLFTTATILASAGSRKITWRGFRYHLHSPEKTEVIPLTANQRQ